MLNKATRTSPTPRIEWKTRVALPMANPAQTARLAGARHAGLNFSPLLTVKPLVDYFAKPKVQEYMSLHNRTWTEMLQEAEKAASSAMEIFAPVAKKIESDPAYARQQAHAVVLNLYQDLHKEVKTNVRYSAEFNEADFIRFLKRETHGEFDIGEILIRTLGSLPHQFQIIEKAKSKLAETGISPRISRVCRENMERAKARALEIFEKGYAFLHTIRQFSK